MKDLKDKELVIFDLETTGLNPQGDDRICEIAAIKHKNGESIDSFHSLINPERPISAAAFRVNRIEDAMLKDAPKIADILPRFFKFIRRTYVAAYNIRFDLNFLQKESKKARGILDGSILFFDILTLARRTLPKLPSYSLANVADHLGLKIQQQHRALSDVELSWQVLDNLFDILKNKGLRSFSEVYMLCGFNLNRITQAEEQAIAFIARAIDFNFDLCIRYLSKSSAQITERRVRPKEIYEENNKKYLLAFCHMRKEERNFALNSILHMDVEEQCF